MTDDLKSQRTRKRLGSSDCNTKQILEKKDGGKENHFRNKKFPI